MCNLSQGVKAEGISIGEMRMLVKLVRKGRVTIEEAAKDAGMTVEKFEKHEADCRVVFLCSSSKGPSADSRRQGKGPAGT